MALVKRVQEDLKGMVGGYGQGERLTDAERQRLGKQMEMDSRILGIVSASTLVVITVGSFIFGGATLGLQVLPFGIAGGVIGYAMWDISRI